MKWRWGFYVLFFLLVSTVPAATKKLKTPYTILTRIKSPYELLADYLPKRYMVSLTLSGSIADEIKSILDTLDIHMAQYSEIFDRKKGFEVIITNKDYTSQTRDLLSGILNPIEMTDIILKSILKYQETDNLLQMQKETSITEKTDTKNGSPKTRLEIKPVGTRFCYQYKDMGAYIHESWLTKLSLTIDPNTMLAHELSIIKHSRTFYSDQQSRPSPSISQHRYTFHYATVNNTVVPSCLEFYIDSILKCKISATYRTSNQFILFDKREIEYFLPDKTTARLLIEYNDYTFTSRPETLKAAPDTGKYSKKLRRAAAHARKAIEALNKGHIQTAVNILQTIVDNYPGTPQAVEAQKLLSGLPDGL